MIYYAYALQVVVNGICNLLVTTLGEGGGNGGGHLQVAGHCTMGKNGDNG